MCVLLLNLFILCVLTLIVYVLCVLTLIVYVLCVLTLKLIYFMRINSHIIRSLWFTNLRAPYNKSTVILHNTIKYLRIACSLICGKLVKEKSI